MTELKHTPLFNFQADRGARFVEFVGWQMPVQYQGVVSEHKATRERAGLFDVTHMGEFIIEGPQATEAVQYAVTNNIAKLVDGKALYTVICLENGGIIDDLIVYRETENRYFLVVNGARCEADKKHLLKVISGYNCQFTDVSHLWAQLALQGPRAFEILAKITDINAAQMPPFSFIDGEVAGIPNVRVARTGYTGEDGVELYLSMDESPKLWRSIEKAGKDFELELCGLGARDTLRLEMKYPLYGNDIDEDHNPYEAGLGWVVKLKKSDFFGKKSLVEIKKSGPKQKLVGFKMNGRGIPRKGYPIKIDGAEVGMVTSGTHSPSLGIPLGIGYVPISHAAVGSSLEIEIRDKVVPAEVVETPFYKRDKK